MQSTQKCVKRLMLGEERAYRQYIRGYNVYMISWKPLVGEYLQSEKEQTKVVDKNTVAVVRHNSHYKKEMVNHVQQKSL